MSLELARQLREGTKQAHTMAENTGFVTCFMKGVVDKNSYRLLISDLYFVYCAMEEEINKLSEQGNIIIRSFDLPELNRTKALQEDLFFLFVLQERSCLKFLDLEIQALILSNFSSLAFFISEKSIFLDLPSGS